MLLFMRRIRIIKWIVEKIKFNLHQIEIEICASCGGRPYESRDSCSGYRKHTRLCNNKYKWMGMSSEKKKITRTTANIEPTQMISTLTDWLAVPVFAVFFLTFYKISKFISILSVVIAILNDIVAKPRINHVYALLFPFSHETQNSGHILQSCTSRLPLHTEHAYNIFP